MKDSNQIGKLAMRREGNYWNAYYQLEDIKVLLVSFDFEVIHDTDMKDEALQFMSELTRRFVSKLSNQEIVMDRPARAPESERSGHA